MGPGENIALIAVVILIIVGLGVMGSMYSRRLAFKERQLELRIAQENSAAPARSTDDVAKLEQRVRVLERIATDNPGRLAAAIEDLRQPHPLKEELQ
jgi:hypothetical protein